MRTRVLVVVSLCVFALGRCDCGAAPLPGGDGDPCDDEAILHQKIERFRHFSSFGQ